MANRFVTIWFRHLKTDWFCRRHPPLRNIPFVLASPDHGRLVITATNILADEQSIYPGMLVADARALVSALQVLDDDGNLENKLLNALAEWCIRYSNIVAIDPPDGLKLDATGCAHLWGGEKNYIKDIHGQLKKIGYDTRVTMADTLGAAWALAHYETDFNIIEPEKHFQALLHFPVSALRLEMTQTDLLIKLGLRQIRHLISIPATKLLRRFGSQLITRLHQALGTEEEILHPVHPVEPYTERLPSLEPIVTATGIEIALERLLDIICARLKKENKGLRKAVFTGFRTDGKTEKIEIGTHRATNNIRHLFKLFELKISILEPEPGIDLFMIEALKTEMLSAKQENIWEMTQGLESEGLSELLDRFSNRFGEHHIHRYLPNEHYWPERSYRPAVSLQEKSETQWQLGRPRPLQMLHAPEPVEVTALVPDYPPMFFRYKGILHKIKKADGPERIEREWWIDSGSHRDYYSVEDEEGRRYWIFRSGHYEQSSPPRWFLHGFFA